MWFFLENTYQLVFFYLVDCSSGTEQKLSQFTSEEIIILYQLFKCLVFSIEFHHIIPAQKETDYFFVVFKNDLLLALASAYW